MKKPEIKKSMLAKIIPGFASFAKRRGLAGKLVIFGAILTIAVVVMTALSSCITPHDPS